MFKLLIHATEKRWIPDPLVRVGIRKLCSDRLKSLVEISSPEQNLAAHAALLARSPVAIETDAANRQHYEIPAEFFKLVLGPYRKYSCAFWASGVTSLAEAELAALDITIERAQIADGMRILELGCGWGSLTLEMARRFPRAQITAISNSKSQREFILSEAKARGLTNVEVLTRNVAELETIGEGYGPFDRVVSVEMFEHVLNYEVLLRRIRGWLAPGGKLFIHIFSHQQFAYLFDTVGEDNWMGRYFFSGGQMPSHALMTKFQKDLTIAQTWLWSGTHYQKTAEAWLKNMDREREPIMKLFSAVYGAESAAIWFQRWRVFFLSVAELFGYRGGDEWGVIHILFERRDV